MSAHPAEDIATAVPQEYALGNREVYVKALAASQAMYSPDGRFVPGAVETAYAVLKLFDPIGRGRDDRSIEDLHRRLCGEGTCGKVAYDEPSR